MQHNIHVQITTGIKTRLIHTCIYMHEYIHMHALLNHIQCIRTCIHVALQNDAIQTR